MSLDIRANIHTNNGDRRDWQHFKDDVVCCITNHYIEIIMSVMSLRLPDEVAETLAVLAKATGRSKSFLAVDALREYLAREAWQIKEIQEALHEADAGDFASPEDVNAIAEKWMNNAG